MKSCVEFFAAVTGITISALLIAAIVSGLLCLTAYFIDTTLITILGG